jgi:hypothetical protein
MRRMALAMLVGASRLRRWHTFLGLSGSHEQCRRPAPQ